jgi:hypothetical protein
MCDVLLHEFVNVYPLKYESLLNNIKNVSSCLTRNRAHLRYEQYFVLFTYII